MPNKIEVQKNSYNNNRVIHLKKSTMHSNLAFVVEQYKNKNVSLLIKSRSVNQEDLLILIESLIETYENLYGK